MGAFADVQSCVSWVVFTYMSFFFPSLTLELEHICLSNKPCVCVGGCMCARVCICVWCVLFILWSISSI